MEEGMTRKGFLVSAAAAGVAALVPAAAFADETQMPADTQPPKEEQVLQGMQEPEEPGFLSSLDVETVQGADALAGSEWAQAAAAAPIDVVKSRSGLHMMNEPGYFAFTGWDVAHDQPVDYGFAFAGDGLVVKAREVRLEAGKVYVGSNSVADVAVEQGTASTEAPFGVTWYWSYRKWANGFVELWGKSGMANWSLPNVYGALYYNGDISCTYPISFIDTPDVIASITSNNGLMHASVKLDTKTGCGFYVSDAIGTARTFYVKVYVTGRWK